MHTPSGGQAKAFQNCPQVKYNFKNKSEASLWSHKYVPIHMKIMEEIPFTTFGEVFFSGVAEKFASIELV